MVNVELYMIVVYFVQGNKKGCTVKGKEKKLV